MDNDRRQSDAPDAAEYELVKAPEEPSGPSPRQRNGGVWVAAVVLLGAAALAAYVLFGRPTPVPAGSPSASAARTAPDLRPLGGVADGVVVPPLDESDAVVRGLVAQLSAHPQVASWLATQGLIRNFTVVVTNIAEGRTPAVHLRSLRPPAAFEVRADGDRLVIDPRSYARYDGVAAAAASIDAAGAARLYGTLKPRIEEAYLQLGAPDGSFDRALERALVRLLATPLVNDPVQVRQVGVGYEFANPDLEALTPAQKQLLRMGPQNAAAVQASLRAIALALGIPAERLPHP